MTKTQAQKLKQLKLILKAVRLRCLDCSANNPYEVKMCVVPTCHLYMWRTGQLELDKKHKIKNTKEKITLTQENTILQGDNNK